jgi:hypothetical protein
MMEAI